MSTEPISAREELAPASPDAASPARLYSGLAGTLLVIAGVAGFFYESSFATGERIAIASGELLGLVAVNGWLNAMHLLLGLTGIAAAGRFARSYALATGLLFTVIAIWGFAAADGGVGTILELIPVDTAGNLIHLLLGLAGMAAGAAAAPAALAPRVRAGREAARRRTQGGGREQPERPGPERRRRLPRLQGRPAIGRARPGEAPAAAPARESASDPATRALEAQKAAARAEREAARRAARARRGDGDPPVG